MDLNLLQHVFHGVTSSLPRVDFRSGCPSGRTWLFHNLQVIKKKIGKIPLVFIKLNKFNITFVPYSTVCLISQFPVSWAAQNYPVVHSPVAFRVPSRLWSSLKALIPTLQGVYLSLISKESFKLGFVLF